MICTDCYTHELKKSDLANNLGVDSNEQWLIPKLADRRFYKTLHMESDFKRYFR